jgi:4a-hydroxytetrahydrobiopterin dehydratase
MSDVLSDSELEKNVPRHWTVDGDEITRTFEFDDYLGGVQFAVECAELAEEEFHHPTIMIGYKQVEVRLTSHDSGGVTDRDIHMAELFNEI